MVKVPMSMRRFLPCGFEAGLMLCFGFGLLTALWGCQPAPSAVGGTQPFASKPSAPPATDADDFLIVDCLLPGQIRKLGRSFVYLSPRRPIRTSAVDCEIRGGEYVAYDRSDYGTALKVWMPLAEEGDQAAQTYVGEIYEKGLGVQPDYALAAVWYRKAAEQGNARAQINLGNLYERGLGVQADPVVAANWYRKAAGLSTAIVLDPASLDNDAQHAVSELRQELAQRTRESETLRHQLDQSRQQLVHTQQELEQKKSEAEAERRAQEEAKRTFEEARQALEARRKQVEVVRDDAELQRLESQLHTREADLERQNQVVAQLRREVDRIEREAEQRRNETAKLSEVQVAFAGPTVEIIEPKFATRGVPTVKMRSGIQGLIVGKVTAPAGLLTLMVNGREETYDSHGLFRAQMPPLQRSPVPVTVVAIDKQGQRAAVEFVLTPEALPAEVKAPTPPQPPSEAKKAALPRIDFGKYYALIIGNKEYTYWPKLDTPEYDAKKLAEVLRRKYGFQTELLLNATRYDILKAFNELRRTMTDQDNLLVFYAGHGYLDTKISRGYWIPIDGEVDSNANWISTFAVTDFLSAISAKHVLIVADSCYAGALTRSALTRLESGASDESRYNWLKIMAEKRSRTVLTSGDLQPVLDGGGAGHSVFAKALLDILGEKDEIVEGQRLYQEVSARVAYAAAAVTTDTGPVEQVPQYAPIRYAGHESGDFLFVPAAN
jgi:hypothetical protein